MIKITLQNIKDFNLPLDNTSKVLKKGYGKETLKQLEKKYNKKSSYMCSKIHGIYEIYANVAYNYIPKEDKKRWITNYEVFIRSSFQYKFWIALYNFVITFEK